MIFRKILKIDNQLDVIDRGTVVECNKPIATETSNPAFDQYVLILWFCLNNFNNPSALHDLLFSTKVKKQRKKCAIGPLTNLLVCNLSEISHTSVALLKFRR